MPTVSWVAGTDPTRVTATSVAANSPAGLANDDALFAFVTVKANTTCIPPAGWTLVNSTGLGWSASPTGYLKVFAYRKDTVTSGDASTSFTFTAGTSCILELLYAAVRIDSGALTTLSSAVDTDAWPGTGGVTDTIPPRTATGNGQMVLAALAYGYADEGSSGPVGTTHTPSGATLWTSPDPTAAFTAGVYQARDNGEAASTGALGWVGLEVWAADYAVTAAVSILVGALDNERTLTDGVQFADLTGQGQTYLDTVTGGVGFTDIPSQQWEDVLLQALGVRVPEGGVSAYPRWSRVATDTIGGADAASTYPRWGKAMTDVIQAASVLGSLYRGAPTLTDVVSLSPVLRTAVPILLSEGVSATEVLRAVQGVVLLQTLGISDTPQAAGRFGLALVQDIATQDALRRFLGADLTETIGAAAVLAGLRRTAPVVSDSLALAEAMGHSAVFRVTVPETVDLDDALLLRALFSPVVDERVEISAAYIQPSGAITTWAVNTRTAATTEYTGYEFRGFARMGRRYLGAARDGLYVLDGDTDDGTSIVADLKSGFAQFAGSRFTTIRAAYIGLRGDGEFRFRIIDGEGVTREYKALVQDMRTAKVNTGRGIRTRYVAFELVSTGQDFTLDSVEMIPILSTRRV